MIWASIAVLCFGWMGEWVSEWVRAYVDSKYHDVCMKCGVMRGGVNQVVVMFPVSI